MRVVTTLILILLVVARSGIPASRPSISTSFAFGFAPATVALLIRTPVSDDNRRLCVDYDSDTGSAGRSCWEDMRAIRQHTLTRLPAGEYQVVATLYTPSSSLRSNLIAFSVAHGDR